jgi:hypothetical protein
MTPGQQECERAVEELRKLFQQVDKAIMNVDSLRKTDKSIQVGYIFLFIIKSKKKNIFSSFIKNNLHLVQIFSLN